MDLFKRIGNFIANFKKNRVFRKKMKVSEKNVQTFLDFQKTIFDVCENKFKELSEKLRGTIRIIVPSEKQQDVFAVIRRDIIKTKLNIRAQLTSDLAEVYEKLTNSNEQNNPAVPVDGKVRDGKPKNSKSGPIPGDIDIEKPELVE